MARVKVLWNSSLADNILYCFERITQTVRMDENFYQADSLSHSNG